ncbi:SDR family oxidoreductase [Rhodomicrobium sp. R_RK_3]|uniref:SDR family oxidoreductase n=1 Tax=Rhodomicrobium TaxID=1068 RepID=UPI000B4B89D8|nr:SDR family oxidoreductase [Rhodomicrobium sp. R_RK_3]
MGTDKNHGIGRDALARLAGKTVLITAAAQGIGRACAEASAREGARVIATDINTAVLDELRAVPGIETRRLDVLDQAAIAALPGEIGKVDALLNVAGYVHSGSILECSDEDWDFAFALNVRSMSRMIKAFLPGMLDQGRGSIVNMSSVVGIAGVPNRYVYSATKAAVVGITKSVAADFVKRGIRSNAICPGTIESPSLEERLKATGDYDAARAAFIARQPIGRLGTPQEIAEVAVYLASDLAGYTTGQTFAIDGGWTL